MANKKGSVGTVSGALIFLGSLVYLYIVYASIAGGAAFSSWLSAAQFFAPFVIAAAVISAVTLFFMGLGAAAGMKADYDKKLLWKFITIGAAAFLIVGGTGWFWVVLAGFVLTYLGGMSSNM